MKIDKIILGLAILLVSESRGFAADPVYDPLWLYQGTWDVTRRAPNEAAVTNKLQNDCAQLGRFFMCQQTVDGKVGALIIFIPAETAGHYYTHPVLPDGRGPGRGDLEIEGDRWTYPRQEQENGKTKYYRITNLFSGKDRIHFEQSESEDGKNWKVTASGDEIRTSKAGTRPDPRQN